MTKRIISFALALIMTCALLPNMFVSAAPIPDGKGPKEIEGGQRDFLWPIPGVYNISGCFIDNRNPPHHAIDIAANGGTKVVAAYDGVVVEAWNSGKGYGKLVMIEHDYQLATGETIKLYSKYNHLNSYTVRAGKKVKAGDKIGTVGKTGGNYGYHLDFQILTSPDWRRLNYHNISIDPYINELLELPADIYCDSTPTCCGVGPTGCCCYYYLEDVKRIYERPVKTYMPATPELKITSDYTENTPVYFAWSEDENATHYELVIEKENDRGDWEAYARETDLTTGLSRQLASGNYRLQLKAYNSLAWVPEGEPMRCVEGAYQFLTIRCSHTYETRITKAPTCAEEGIQVVTCSVCGESNEALIPATGAHTYGDWEVLVAGSCTQAEIQVRTCAGCGTQQKQFETVPGHHMEGGVCSVCGETEYLPEAQGACGSDLTWCLYQDGVVVIAGTGLLETASWSAAGLPSVEAVILPAGITGIGEAVFPDPENVPHIFFGGDQEAWSAIAGDNAALVDAHCNAGETDLRRIATCNTQGLYCLRCDRFLTDKTLEGTCAFVLKNTVPSGCTTQGYTSYTCPGCGQSHIDSASYQAALGHAFGQMQVVTPVTCETDGVSRAECARCDAFVEEIQLAAGHDYVPTVKEPGYTTAGGTEYICVCGDSYREGYQRAYGLPAPVVTVEEDAYLGLRYLVWEHDGEADYYEIYRATSKNGKYTKVDEVQETRWLDTTATVGKTYYYQLRAICKATPSLSSSNCEVLSVVHACAKVQMAVENNLSSGKPVLSWNKISGAAKYEVYRSADGETFKRLATTTKRTYTDTKATAGKQYYYKVRAIASKSTYNGLYSDVLSCWSKYARPTLSVSVDKATGRPSLSWKSVTGATAYRILQLLPDGSQRVLTQVQGKTYLDETALLGATCQYAVQAIGAAPAADSEPSAAKSATVTCGQPVLTGSVNEDGKPVIAWEPVPDAVEYIVYRSTKSGSGYKQIDVTGKTEYTDLSVAPGKTYYYKVVAQAGASVSAYSSYKKLTGKCDVPTLNVENNETSGKPVLSWNKISGAKKYEIYRSVDGGAFKRLTSTTKLTYTDTKASAGTVCVYKVRACGSSSSYNSLFSQELSLEVFCAQPSVTVKVDAATGKPSLSWKKISGAQCYEIFRDAESLGTVTDLKFLDTTACPGEAYAYTVKALGREGAYPSIQSKAVTATATCAQPAKPTVTLEEESKKPVVSWKPVEGADGYAVYRSTSSGSKSFKLLPDVQLTVTEDGLSMLDLTTKAGKTYYYKVVALCGDVESAQSGYAKIKSK